MTHQCFTRGRQAKNQTKSIRYVLWPFFHVTFSLQHNLLRYQRLSIAIRHSTRHKRDMADELSYDDAVALLLDELRGTGGQAEWRVIRAVERGGDGHFLGEVDGLKDIEKKSICFAATDRINK